MNSGYITIPRDFGSDLLELPANDVKLFILLVFRAAWRDTLTCKRGTLFDSFRGMAKRSGLTVDILRTSLTNLTLLGLIERNSTQRRTDIRIVNYDRFGMRSSNCPQSAHTEPTLSPQTAHSKKKLRSEEVKEVKNTSTSIVQTSFEPDSEFQKVWERYPKRRGRKAALRHFRASVRTPEDLKAIGAALDAYLAELRSSGRGLEFTLNGSTWFNDWQSYRDQPKAQLTPPKELKPPTIPDWKIIPPEEDLVTPAEIQAFMATLKPKSVRA